MSCPFCGEVHKLLDSPSTKLRNGRIEINMGVTCIDCKGQYGFDLTFYDFNQLEKKKKKAKK